MTIELNEQQAEFLKQTLLAIDFEKVSGTSKSIISQILIKLE